MTDPDAAGGGGEYQVVVGKSLHLIFGISVEPHMLPHPTDPPSLWLELTTRIRMDKRRSPLSSR